MKTARFRSWLSGLVLLALVAAPSRGDTTLRWKFQKGKKYNYTTTKKVNSKAEIQGNKIDSTLTQVMDVTWDVKDVKSDGSARMSQTIDRIRFKMEAPPPLGNLEYDTKDAGEPEGLIQALAPVFKALVGSPIELTMSDRGEVSDVKLPEKLMDTLKNAGPAGAMFAGNLGSEDGLKAMMSKVSLTLPKDDLAKGKTWTSTNETPTPPTGTTVEENTFTYAGPVDQGGAKLEKVGVKVKVDMKVDDKSPFKVKIEKQDSDGSFLFDNAAGQLKNFELTQKMTTKTTVNGQEFEQQVDSVFTTEQTKPGSGSSKEDKEEGGSAKK